MNGAYLHLVVNHVSLFSLLFGVVSLAVSMKRNCVELRVLATILFIVAGIFGWIAVETGEYAEEVVKALGGGTESFIKEHADAASWAQISGIIVAMLAIVLEWAVRKKKNWVRVLQWVLLVFAIHSSTVFVRTAYLGGHIRHTEIRSMYDNSKPMENEN